MRSPGDRPCLHQGLAAVDPADLEVAQLGLAVGVTT